MKKLQEKWKSFSRKKKIWIGVGLFIFVAIWILLILWWSVWSWTTSSWCEVGAISIQGDISSHLSEDDYTGDYVSADEVIQTLRYIEDSYKVAMVDLTSWGGGTASSKEIADFIAQMSIPVVVSVREAAVSGGYYIASQADEVFAAPFSDIGSIGVTMSYLEQAESNKKNGAVWRSLSSGEFKDAGREEVVLTEQAREIFMRDINILHNQFVQDVATGRGLPLEEVERFADGSTVMAEKALELGLIDGIKHQWEVEEYIKESYGVEGICWE